MGGGGAKIGQKRNWPKRIDQKRNWPKEGAPPRSSCQSAGPGLRDSDVEERNTKVLHITEHTTLQHEASVVSELCSFAAATAVLRDREKIVTVNHPFV